MKQLIVNADDFGADACRNQGIAAAVTVGAVTAVSVLVNGPAFADGLPLLGDWQRRGIAVGLHLNLSEGRPLAKGVTALSGVDGSFRGKAATHALLMKGQNGKLAEDILAETEAQIARLRETGIRIDHLDSHQHVHVFPAAAGVVVAAAVRHGIPRVRIPAEPPVGEAPGFSIGETFEKLPASSRTVIPDSAGAQPAAAASLLREAALFSGLAAAARRLFAAAGVRTTDHFRGLDLKGRLSLPLLDAVFRELPPGLTELMVHPGAAPDTAGAGPFAAFATVDRQRELAILLAPEFFDLLKQYEIKMISQPEDRS